MINKHFEVEFFPDVVGGRKSPGDTRNYYIQLRDFETEKGTYRSLPAAKKAAERVITGANRYASTYPIRAEIFVMKGGVTLRSLYGHETSPGQGLVKWQRQR